MAQESSVVVPEIRLRRLVREALREDGGRGDATTIRVLPGRPRGVGTIRAKERLLLAGLPVAHMVFGLADSSLRFERLAGEGKWVERGTPVARIRGPAASILRAERTALNFLQHLSGIATYTADCVVLAAGQCSIRDTRKTTPGLRELEKYAVRLGGGENHRLRLDDGILIKHNHWRLAGGVRSAVARARAAGNRRRPLPIQVEVSTIRDLREALGAGADAVLLDNFPPSRLATALRIARGKAFVEISGGITRENLAGYARLRPDAVSMGALTHSSRWVDLSLSLAAAS